ncbi:hypothetical protein IQ250_07875 [Pseudanabaenaceae cyanobacterium LEGE 13415]|nr:hypothetical protein [Pseudanabaenaceae cyanobacterium LEGE 13415]
MEIADYSEPLIQLLTQGEYSWGGVESWLDYRALGITENDIPSLIAMATNDDLYELDSEAAEGWAPVHAWRALGQLQAEAAVMPLLQQSLKYEDPEGWRDWMMTELPTVLRMNGIPAIPVLAAWIHDRTLSGWQRSIPIEGLDMIAKSYPEATSDCVAILQKELAQFEANDPEMNAFVIGSLVDLRVMEAVPLIEQAFAAGKVDELFNGDWDDIQVSLGLKSADEVPRKRYDLHRSLGEPEFVSVEFDTTNYERQKAKKKAKRKQQADARRKNRKKK